MTENQATSSNSQQVSSEAPINRLEGRKVGSKGPPEMMSASEGEGVMEKRT